MKPLIEKKPDVGCGRAYKKAIEKEQEQIFVQ